MIADEAVQNNPDQLYAAIARSLQAGDSTGLKPAAQRLLQIDPDQERALITNGLVHLRLGKHAVP